MELETPATGLPGSGACNKIPNPELHRCCLASLLGHSVLFAAEFTYQVQGNQFSPYLIPQFYLSS